MANLIVKKQRLMSVLKGFDSLAIAFSGGVDSSFLAAAAYRVLGEKLLAITAVSPIHPKREKEAAILFAAQLGMRHVLTESKEMNSPEFAANTRERCYVCKKLLFAEIAEIAAASGIRHIAHGANTDDLNDFRPGSRAAEEMGIFAPLTDSGLSKADIRGLSREMNLSVWNRPAMACLATRIPYDTPISAKRLRMIEDAEEILHGLGIGTCRVRHHENIARIEVLPEEFGIIADNRQIIVENLRKIGFSYIAWDLAGYVQGSMNINKPDGGKSESCYGKPEIMILS